MLSVNYETIPPSLRQRKQWLVWRLEQRPDSKKPTKIPYNALTGRHAKSNDPLTWCDFNRAGQMARKGEYDGVGFAFMEGDGLVGIDLDHVLDPETGAMVPWAIEVLDRFKGTYIERSPSGTGIRIFCLGTVERCGKGTEIKEIEIYTHKSPRYLTVTGQAWPFSAADPTGQQEALDWLHQRFFAPRQAAAKPAKPAPVLALGDNEILEKALKQPKFAALWAGDDGGDHSSADLSLCCLLAFWFGGDAARMDRIFRSSALYRDKWDKKHSADGKTYGEMTLDKAITVTTEYYDPNYRSPGSHAPIQQGGGGDDGGPPDWGDEEPPPDGTPRQDIEIGGDKLVSAMRIAERVLFGGDDPPFFQRDGLLMRLAPIEQTPDSDGRVKRPTGAIVLTPVNAQWIRRQMMHVCRFRSWSKQTKEFLAVNLPKDYAESYLESGEWFAPVLRYVAHCPQIRKDGTILSDAGYDPQTGIYMASKLAVKMPPERKPGEAIEPSTDVAVRWAYNKLFDLFQSFEPETLGDLSAIVSAILSGLVESSLVRAPGLVITSPIPGTGKGKVADMIAAILTGRRVSKMTMEENQDAFRKALFSSLLAGDKIVCIDEVKFRLVSAALNSAMVEESITDRVLQVSKMATVKTSDTLFIALGNNIGVENDATRRWLRAYLNPHHPEPHKRVFPYDPVEHVLAHRSEYITAGLTILHGFFAAGKPRMAPDGCGSYEGWNQHVRNALIWAGFDDPWRTIEQWKGQDDDMLELSGLLACWWKAYGEEPRTSQQVCADLSDCQHSEALKELKAVVDGIALEKSKYNTRKLGNKLKKNKNRIIITAVADGLGNERPEKMMLENCGISHQAQLWRVVKA